MSEDHNRLLAELQGAASEVLGLRISGKASAEAEAQLAQTLERVSAAEKEYREQAARLSHARDTVRYALEARGQIDTYRRQIGSYGVSARDWETGFLAVDLGPPLSSKTPAEAFGESARLDAIEQTREPRKVPQPLLDDELDAAGFPLEAKQRLWALDLAVYRTAEIDALAKGVGK